MTTKPLPCPFCGSEIKHIKSWARSFSPPRLYHEWHHINDDVKICHLLAYGGKIIMSATDDAQDDRIACWNKRFAQLEG